MDKPPASIALEKLNIPHQVFKHEIPVTSFEQAASDRNQRPEQVVRSILFQIRPEEFLMDASDLKEEEISIGSGVRNMAIIMKSADLRQALSKSEVVSLLESS